MLNDGISSVMNHQLCFWEAAAGRLRDRNELRRHDQVSRNLGRWLPTRSSVSSTSQHWPGAAGPTAHRLVVISYQL
jgi:hypothetical protein